MLLKAKSYNLKATSGSGFTLIELLVVIAIISLLSSIILASLGTARAKAADAAIKSDLVSVRTQAELQFQEKGCYTNTAPCTSSNFTTFVCPAAGTGSIFGQTNIAAQIAAAKLAGGSYASCDSFSSPQGTRWAVAVVLKTSKTKAWCVDNFGTSKEINSAFGDYTQGILNEDIYEDFGSGYTRCD